MKKFLNDPAEFVDNMLDGLYKAHPGMVTYVGGDRRCLVRTDSPTRGKVGIATGGGSGHLPLFLGYVGEGMLDGCSIGGVFQSPSAEQMLEVTKAIDGGAGVLYIYGNYSGDIMNFEMAIEMAEDEGIQVEQIVAGEDVASAPKDEMQKRRGVAGIFFVYKIAGAKAAQGADLKAVKRVAEKAASNVRTMGVALSANTIPEVGKARFSIGDNEMEIGMGIHGEPGIRRGKLQTADEIVDEMMSPILEDLPYASGNEVAVLVNGLGATPLEELYVLFNRVHDVLENRGISIHSNYIGEYVTSLEMAGASISLLRLDEELKPLLDAAAKTPFFQQLEVEREK